MFTKSNSSVVSAFLDYGILIEDEKLKNKIFSLDDPYRKNPFCIKGWHVGTEGWIYDSIYYVEIIKNVSSNQIACVAFADNVDENLIVFARQSIDCPDKNFIGLKESLELFVRDFDFETNQELEIQKNILLEQFF